MKRKEIQSTENEEKAMKKEKASIENKKRGVDAKERITI